MPAVTIRNIPEEIHRAIQVRASRHNRSTEAEIRSILELAVQPKDRLKLGSAIVDLTRSQGLTEAELAAMAQAQDLKPAEPLIVE